MCRTLARLALVLGAIAAAACGKKGPPLAPIVRIPAGIETIQPQRVGNDVYLTLTVPAQNIDRTTPVDIARVDVYGYTGRSAPPRGLFANAATLVASVPVLRPDPAAAAGGAGSPSAAGAGVGTMVTVVDRITPDELVPGKELSVPLPRGARAPALPTTAPAAADSLLRRYYLAVGVSSRGEPGPQGTPIEVPLFPLPDPPAEVRVAVTAMGATLRWDPPGGIVGFLFDRSLGPEPSPQEDDERIPSPPADTVRPPLAAPRGPTLYNVYARSGSPAPAAPPEPEVADAWRRAPATPINRTPLELTEFTDAVEFGVERCYTVRAIRGTPPNVLEGEPSPEQCITAVDTFPPAAPEGLAAVAAEGAISLIWEPSSDPDFAGYVVLRGVPGDATLQPLTAMPITEARFADSAVTAGTRYVYAVVAVDKAMNRSVESTRVEETAR